MIFYTPYLYIVKYHLVVSCEFNISEPVRKDKTSDYSKRELDH